MTRNDWINHIGDLVDSMSKYEGIKAMSAIELSAAFGVLTSILADVLEVLEGETLH